MNQQKKTKQKQDKKSQITAIYTTICRSTGSRQGERPAVFFPMTARDRSGDIPLTADNVCMKITNLLCVRYNDSIRMFKHCIYIYIHIYAYTYLHVYIHTYTYTYA